MPTEPPFVGSVDAQRYLRGTQSNQQYTRHAAFDLSAAIAYVTGEWLNKLKPPPDVAAKNIGIIRKKRTLTAPDSITYITDIRKVFGFDICVGWQVIEHPLNANPLNPGKPRQDWVFYHCNPRDMEAIPSPSPSPSPSLR